MYEALRSIKNKGFKSIKDCHVQLHDINVLIGSNGAGKSNFISIFTLLDSVLKKDLQIYSARVGSSSLLYRGRKETKSIEMDFDFGHNSYGFKLVPTDDGRLIFSNEYYEYNGTHSYIESSRGSLESHWDEGVRNGMDRYVRPILSGHEWRVYHFHDTSKDARVKQEHNVQNNTGLMCDAGNLAAFLYLLKNQYDKQYRLILDNIRLVAPFISDLVLEPYGESDDLISLRWRQTGCDEIFNASQLSDGTLRFICLATLLFQPDRFLPSTIVIDEPELGLHPYAITVLSDMIKEVSRKVQIIISTQSSELLDEFDTEDILVVETESDGTKFKRLDPDQLKVWIEDDYCMGDLWKKNIIGGRP